MTTQTQPSKHELHRRFQLNGAIDRYFAANGGDAEQLLADHDRYAKRDGWPSFGNFNAQGLKKATREDIEHALHHQTQEERDAAESAVMKKRKNGAILNEDQVKRIHDWFYNFPLDKAFFVEKHNRMLSAGGWDDHNPLNTLSVDDLGLALFYGYTVNETDMTVK